MSENMIVPYPVTINSTFICRNAFAEDVNNECIKVEPQFYNCDLDFAHKHGGPITKSFLKALHVKEGVFDSRVHMLMPGWYPCIPGWHHDDVGRDPLTGQPDYVTPRYHAHHYAGVVNAEVAPTEFLLGNYTLPAVKRGQTVYKVWDEALEAQPLRLVQIPDRRIIKFDWLTFHRGVPAVKNGWRWFGRVSTNTERLNHVTNEIRTQTQVYLPVINQGW
jgi:hypothetical protein